MEDLLSFIFLIGLAFYWLMCESQWLAIRLERTPLAETPLRGEIDIRGLLMVGIGMVFLAGLKPFSLSRSHTYTEEDHEKDMVRLWEFYGRKQPQIPQVN